MKVEISKNILFCYAQNSLKDKIYLKLNLIHQFCEKILKFPTCICKNVNSENMLHKLIFLHNLASKWIFKKAFSNFILKSFFSLINSITITDVTHVGQDRVQHFIMAYF